MSHIKPLTIKNQVSPLTSAVRSNSENSLGSVLSLVRSSHEPVFIFDDNDKFLGLISPFETLFSSNYPHTTKVSSIVFKPPAITADTPIYKVAKHMLAAKMYGLPVFSEEGKLSGVIYGKDILQKLIRNSALLEFVSEKIEPHTPITAPITALVKDVFYDFKEKGVSRMILTDNEGALAGIVTRGDLMYTLIKPTAKMRFAGEGSRIGHRSLAGEKKSRKSEPVTQFYTALVNTLPDDTSNVEIVRHIIASAHNNIVLVDKFNKPTGFVSTRDILQALTQLRPEKTVSITVRRPSDSVSDAELEHATEFLDLFAQKLKKRMKIAKIEVTTKEPKNAKGETKTYNITLLVTPVAGKSLVAVVSQRNFVEGIQEATALIEKQRRRSGLSKRETAKS